MDDHLQGASLPRVRRSRAAARMATAAVLAAGLTACTSTSSVPPTAASSAASADTSPSVSPAAEPSSRPEPTSAPEPEPDPEPTQTEDRSELLIQPDDMTKTGRAGAIAAAKYYMGLYEYVYLTGDLEMWESMALPGCDFCDVVVETVTEMHKVGQYRESGPPKWRGEANVEHIAMLDQWDVSLRAKVSGSTTYDAAGDVIDTNDSGPALVTVGVVRKADSWRVAGIVVESIG